MGKRKVPEIQTVNTQKRLAARTLFLRGLNMDLISPWFSIPKGI